MPLPFQLALIALVGVGCGFLGHRFGHALRGTIGERMLLTYLLRGVPLIPGGLLVGFFFSQYYRQYQAALDEENLDLIPRGGLYGLSFALALLIPYLGTRFALEATSKGRARQRERALPFEHWFELIRTNPTLADAFLTNYLRQENRLSPDLLAEVRTACKSLEMRHASDRLLPLAVQKLRHEAARLEALQPAGPQASREK